MIISVICCNYVNRLYYIENWKFYHVIMAFLLWHMWRNFKIVKKSNGDTTIWPANQCDVKLLKSGLYDHCTATFNPYIYIYKYIYIWGLASFMLCMIDDTTPNYQIDSACNQKWLRMAARGFLSWISSRGAIIDISIVWADPDFIGEWGFQSEADSIQICRSYQYDNRPLVSSFRPLGFRD